MLYNRFYGNYRFPQLPGPVMSDKKYSHNMSMLKPTLTLMFISATMPEKTLSQYTPQGGALRIATIRAVVMVLSLNKEPLSFSGCRAISSDISSFIRCTLVLSYTVSRTEGREECQTLYQTFQRLNFKTFAQMKGEETWSAFYVSVYWTCTWESDIRARNSQTFNPA